MRQRDGLQADLTAVERERDPSPRGPEFWARRDRPEGVTSTGAPFWRLVEMIHDEADGEPEAVRAKAARLEAALDAAGLLQAWVTPDGAYLADRDGNESVWVPASSTAIPSIIGRSSLRSVLCPADDAGGLAERSRTAAQPGRVRRGPWHRGRHSGQRRARGAAGRRCGRGGGRPLAARRSHRDSGLGPGRPSAARRCRAGHRPATSRYAATGADRCPGDGARDHRR